MDYWAGNNPCNYQFSKFLTCSNTWKVVRTVEVKWFWRTAKSSLHETAHTVKVTHEQKKSPCGQWVNAPQTKYQLYLVWFQQQGKKREVTVESKSLAGISKCKLRKNMETNWLGNQTGTNYYEPVQALYLKEVEPVLNTSLCVCVCVWERERERERERENVYVNACICVDIPLTSNLWQIL